MWIRRLFVLCGTLPFAAAGFASPDRIWMRPWRAWIEPPPSRASPPISKVSHNDVVALTTPIPHDQWKCLKARDSSSHRLVAPGQSVSIGEGRVRYFVHRPTKQEVNWVEPRWKSVHASVRQ
jgi:hypothetical protein